MTERAKNSTSITQLVNTLKHKDKEPRNVRVLSSWISHAANQLELDEVGRLEWLIATTVATAKLQQVIDSNATALFSIKGGTLLQHRLGATSRATKDLDGIVRGDIDTFINQLDAILNEPWGPIEFSRSEVESIRVSTRIVNPRRFDLVLSIRGVVWRRVKIEISPDEGLAGSSQEKFPSPTLAPFGLPTPDSLVGMTMSYQVAQKVHAASMPHNPPQYSNLRVRDVADLIAIKRMCEETGTPTDVAISSAIRDAFTARAEEANQLGNEPRPWPVKLTAYSHWHSEFSRIAETMGIALSLEEAISEVNEWLTNM